MIDIGIGIGIGGSPANSTDVGSGSLLTRSYAISGTGRLVKVRGTGTLAARSYAISGTGTKYTNQIANASAFNGGSWSRLNIGTIITGQADPDGGTSGQLVPDNNTNGTHAITQNPAGLSGTVIARLRAKAGTSDHFVMVLNNLGIKVRFDVTAVSATVTAGSPASQTIVALTGGWYLCTVVYTWTTSGMTIRTLAAGSTTESYVGTGQTIALYKAELLI